MVIEVVKSSHFFSEKANLYQPWAGRDFVRSIMGFYPPSFNGYSSNRYISGYGVEYQDAGSYIYDSFDYFLDEPSIKSNSNNEFYEEENQDAGDYLYDSLDYVADEPYVAVYDYTCWYCW